jgi:uncharacterized protein with FMN-binding domain
MKRPTIQQSILSLGVAVAAGSPIAHAWAAPASAKAASRDAKARTSKAVKAQTFKGPAVDALYGPVQVSITVKRKRIAGIHVVNNPDSARGQFLQGEAVPILRQETLRAQSAAVNVVSGATQTSDGYIQSLAGAIAKARRAKALK